LGIVCLILAAAAMASAAQDGQPSTNSATFISLLSFSGTDGKAPTASLVQGFDGNLYGTTSDGGASNLGTVFKLTLGGTLTTLHSFDGTDGAAPHAGLVQGTEGNFYRTTVNGGANNAPACAVGNIVGCGTVFKITPGGTLTTLHSFDGTDGGWPTAALVQATNGNFYVTTLARGKDFPVVGYGTVFAITVGGTLTTLHSFDSTDGAYPYGGLVQATDGNFYGTTEFGGANNVAACAAGGLVGCGTVFKITLGGTLTTLHSFDGTDGGWPTAALVQATDGNLYGTTSAGGKRFPVAGYGTVFAMTVGGTLTSLYSFCPESGCADGAAPHGGLVQATDGNFYGTTEFGGGNDFCSDGDSEVGCGTVFKITPGAALTTPYSFCSKTSCADGQWPLAGLVQGTNGKFYGTTSAGGANGGGTVFSLDVGLGPFVETLPTSGGVGAAVIILGNNLTGSAVTFNGTPAPFTAGSSTAIQTTVPSGATTGKVQVKTPSGTLTSNVNFRVTPTIPSCIPVCPPPAPFQPLRGAHIEF
jgi:uncharacterized repeat protein (TIGR03803 family)